MSDFARQIITGQFEAALAMMADCVEQCPDEHWDDKIAKYPFWLVAYHTLCFVDLYLSPDEKAFKPRADLHPAGWSEYDDEYPSRRFDKSEITRYLTICREKASEILAAETPASLEGPSGHSRLAFSRGELHIYNTRHIMHHTGQLSAVLRKLDRNPRWVKSGWG